MTWLLARLGLACRHANYTFPQTEKHSCGQLHTHVSCLDCGRTLPYSWRQMAVVPDWPCTTKVVGLNN